MPRKFFLSVLLFFVFLSFVLSAQSSNNSLGGFCGSSTGGACQTAADCVTGGCSGQVCQSRSEEPVITTCEYRDCYSRASYGVSCGCVNNRCEWGGPVVSSSPSPSPLRCQKDADCSQIYCVRAPCPQNACVSGRCVMHTCGDGICEAGENAECPACYYSEPPCLAPCVSGRCMEDCVIKNSDLNADGKVNVTDLGIFLSNWNKTGVSSSDINSDGVVDVIDLGILLSNWN